MFSGEWEEHQSHDVVAMVTEEMLDCPTHLLSPLEERKAHAVGLCGVGPGGPHTQGVGDIRRVCIAASSHALSHVGCFCAAILL